jgi:hypothetical protein
VISLLVSQVVTDTAAGLRTFPRSDWTYALRAAPLARGEAAAGEAAAGEEALSEDGATSEAEILGPVLLPVAFGRDLGCDVPGCGESAEEGAVTSVAGAPNSAPGPVPTPTTQGDRAVATELQQELARLGCYTLAVDGLWGPGSQRAMAAFNAAKGTNLPEGAPSARALVEVARVAETVCTE